MKHSKSDVVLFDAHNCPPEFINTAMSAGSHALSGAGGEGGGMGAKPDSVFSQDGNAPRCDDHCM